jgi:FKBP-type peptidyl-prolyl cis-trans isomerase FkpA
MKKTTLLLTILSVLVFNACKNMSFEKTKTGLEYKIIKGDKGEALDPGDIVKFQYKVTFKDSLVITTYNTMPAYDQVDSLGRHHDFSEFLSQMNVGDSAVCYQLFDTLQKKPEFGLPPYMKKGDKQEITIKVLAVFKAKNGANPRDLAVEDYRKEIELFKTKEMAAIEKYLNNKKINAVKVNNNVFVQIETEGTGLRADSGKLVGVKYSGYNFDGKYFDSNTDTTRQLQKHPLETFFFTSKQEGAIQGMLEGITLFKVGTKGKMFIPSLMAYGPQGMPPAIKPNENLIFDIEVVEVKDKPAAPQQPEMPQPNR